MMADFGGYALFLPKNLGGFDVGFVSTLLIFGWLSPNGCELKFDLGVWIVDMADWVLIWVVVDLGVWIVVVDSG